MVYQISCLNCPKVYIGQSGRTLKHRLSEHRRALQSGHVASSVLAEHTWSTGHRMDLSKVEVVDAQPLCDHMVSPGELAHPTPPTHVESRKVYSLLTITTSLQPEQYSCFLLRYSYSISPPVTSFTVTITLFKCTSASLCHHYLCTYHRCQNSGFNPEYD